MSIEISLPKLYALKWPKFQALLDSSQNIPKQWSSERFGNLVAQRINVGSPPLGVMLPEGVFFVVICYFCPPLIFKDHVEAGTPKAWCPLFWELSKSAWDFCPLKAYHFGSKISAEILGSLQCSWHFEVMMIWASQQMILGSFSLGKCTCSNVITCHQTSSSFIKIHQISLNWAKRRTKRLLGAKTHTLISRWMLVTSGYGLIIHYKVLKSYPPSHVGILPRTGHGIWS